MYIFRRFLFRFGIVFIIIPALVSMLYFALSLTIYEPSKELLPYDKITLSSINNISSMSISK